jgi:signal transduction histidine kinase/DNA-binding response OmpR family regulator
LKSTELLSYISDLEVKLNSFSFEELTADKAARLKKSFQYFKENIEGDSVSNAETFLKTQADASPKSSEKLVSKDSEELLIAKVSHEIRTPLNGIIGFTELLLEDTLSDLQRSHVSAIKSASKTLLAIINELLEYSKVSSGNSPIESVNFNIHHLIKDVCYLCKTLIVNEDVIFNFSIDDKIPNGLIGDPSKLSQIILNLVGNAIKFVEKGSIDVKVEANITKDDKLFLRFTIKDTGIGIAENNLETIFDYYKQADAHISKKYGGTGLGLGIVKHLITSLNGEISVTSKEGEGTTFVFSIPYKISTKAVVETSVILEDKNTIAAQLKDVTILVFEDNTMNQKLIQNRLHSWGGKSFITDDVQEGLLLLETQKIDLILMDLRMPKTSGFEVAKIIRANKETKIKTVPIIALTADFSVKDKDLYQKSGINDYVLKPFDAKELLKKIKTIIAETPNDITNTTNSMLSELNQSNTFDVNLEPLFKECLNDLEILEELIQLFKVNVIEFIGKTKIDLKNADFEAIRFNAHKIKASLKMMHAHGLFRIVEQMHKICAEDRDSKYLNFLYDCFITEYPVIENAIENSLMALKNSKQQGI